MAELAFPEGFEWGSATAAHQIEGGNVHNDWWRWEHAEGTPCIESSGDACDSWNRWHDDVEILAATGIPGYRFSVEWSRVQPAPGEWSVAALDHYEQMCEALLRAGVAPTVTLHHFTSPQWLADAGGWTDPDTPARFAEFAHRVMERLGPLTHRVCTLNEPNMVAAMGHLMGLFPPGRTEDAAGHELAANAMVQAHRLGVDAVRSAAPGVPVGITVAMMDYQVGDGGERTAAASEAIEDRFLDATTGDDFVGVQCYSRMLMGPHGWMGPQPGVPVIETMGYEYWPEALGATVRRAWERTGGVPILVTENGIATDDDERRVRFVHEALTSLHACIDDGIDVRGYTYWSLLDNFEWVLGYGPRFGLVAVDRSTFHRTAKPSAIWFGQVAQRNALSDGPPTPG